MKKSVLCISLLLLAAVLTFRSSAAEIPGAAQNISLTATGVGSSDVEALLNVFRNAIRQGCSFYMRSRMEIVNDLIKSHSFDVFVKGQVVSHKILSRKRAGGKVILTAAVEVSPEKLRSLERFRQNEISVNSIMNIVQQIKFFESAADALKKIWAPERFDGLYSVNLAGVDFKADRNSRDHIRLAQRVKVALRPEGFRINAANTWNIIAPYAVEKKTMTYENFMMKYYEFDNHQRFQRQHRNQYSNQYWFFVAESPRSSARGARIDPMFFKQLERVFAPPSFFTVSSILKAEKDVAKFQRQYQITFPLCYTRFPNAIFVHPFGISRDEQVVSTEQWLEKNKWDTYPLEFFSKSPQIKAGYFFSSKRQILTGTDTAADNDPVEVTVSGMGGSEREAENNAVSEGVNQAIGCFIAAKTEYSALLHTEIYENTVRKEKNVESLTETLSQRLAGMVKKFRVKRKYQKNGVFFCEAEVSVLPSGIRRFLPEPEYGQFFTDRVKALDGKTYSSKESFSGKDEKARKREEQRRKREEQRREFIAMQQRAQLQVNSGKEAAELLFGYLNKSIIVELKAPVSMQADTVIRGNVVSGLKFELQAEIDKEEFRKVQEQLLPLIENSALSKFTYENYAAFSFSRVLANMSSKWNVAFMKNSGKEVESFLCFSMPKSFREAFFSKLKTMTGGEKQFFPTLYEVVMYDGQNNSDYKSFSREKYYPFHIDFKNEKIILAPVLFYHDRYHRFAEKKITPFKLNMDMRDLKNGNQVLEVYTYFGHDITAWHISKQFPARQSGEFQRRIRESMKNNPHGVYPLQVYFSYWDNPLAEYFAVRYPQVRKRRFLYSWKDDVIQTPVYSLDMLSPVQREYYHFYKRQAGLSEDAIRYLQAHGWKHSGLGFVPHSMAGKKGFRLCYVSPELKCLKLNDTVRSFNGKRFSSVTELMRYLKQLNENDQVKLETSCGNFTVTLSGLRAPSFVYGRSDRSTQSAFKVLHPLDTL